MERIKANEGDTVELDKVLLISDGDRVTTGTPHVEGAKVVATAKGEGKEKKVIIFRYKSKVRSRKKTGHRQLYTRLAIDNIISPVAAAEPPKSHRRKKEVMESGT